MRVRWILLPWTIAACAGREPVRFGSPLLGMAQVPPPTLPGEPPRPDGPSNHDPMPHEDRPQASESAAAAVARSEIARARTQLPAPHRAQAERHCALPPCRFRTPVDLHDVVGHREKGDAMAITLGWARELGLSSDATTAIDLIAWAERSNRLHGAGEQPSPGDLLIFERTASDDGPDLIAIVVDRDPRGVIEMIYIAGGVVRRGFVDASRPTKRRDRDGAVVNTYLRHGKRSPPKGTRYLAGELLVHVIASRRSASP